MKKCISLLLLLICCSSYGQINIVFRCDDFRMVDDCLQEQILDVFSRHKVQLSICIVPADTTSQEVYTMSDSIIERWRELIRDGLLEVGLHGFMHRNLNPNICKWNELEDLTYKQQLGRFAEGKEMIESHLGEISFFVPPRNVINDYTIKALERSGFKVLSANVSNTEGYCRNNHSRIILYPCTTEDFSAFDDFYSNGRFGNFLSGTVIVLFHGYTFSEGRYSFEQLDNLLERLSNDHCFKICGFNRLLELNVDGYDGGLRGKYLPLMRLLFGDRLFYLNKPSKVIADASYYMVFALLALLITIPVWFSRKRIKGAVVLFLYLVFVGPILFLFRLGYFKALFIIVILGCVIDLIFFKNRLIAFLKQIYIYFRYLFHRYIKNRFVKSVELFDGLSADKVFPQKETLFGYYNLSPENKNGDVLGFDFAREPNVNVLLKRKGITSVIGLTRAFNYQQGAMLQWAFNSSNILYYNVYNSEGNRYECVCYDSDSQSIVDTLPLPVCCISRDRRYALSLNFERLAAMRPDYGYFCRGGVTLPELKEDGIWKIDMKTKEVSLIISLERLKDLKYVETMDGAEHKVNHIDISPDGKRFMFLHRWVGPKGRYMRLITSDENGEDLYILNGDKMTSHSCWYDDRIIISFCHTEEYGNAYVSFLDKTNQIELVSKELPTEDGHPSVSPNKKWMITDCYPGFHRMSSLFLLNLETKKVLKIGSFYQPLKYNGTTRIDLHPKWNQYGDKIYFESGHNGLRNLYCVNIGDLVNEKAK